MAFFVSFAMSEQEEVVCEGGMDHGSHHLKMGPTTGCVVGMKGRTFSAETCEFYNYFWIKV